MRARTKTLILFTLGLAVGAAAAGVVALYAGFYNVAATHQHFAPTFWLLKTAMRESVERRARGIDVPPLGDPAMKAKGFALYHAHCVQCHGAPGVAPEPFALGLTPTPTNLAHGVRARTAAELFWVVKNGIKMTAMPAWEFRLAEGDLWSLVAFLRDLPQIAPADYAAQATGLGPSAGALPERVPIGPPDAKRGRVAVEQYACLTCHRIPGAVGEQAPVGPPLDRIATRQFLGGVIANTPENMVRWLRDPQKIHPGTAMPDLGVSERDARDITAYLYTLK